MEKITKRKIFYIIKYCTDTVQKIMNPIHKTTTLQNKINNMYNLKKQIITATILS